MTSSRVAWRMVAVLAFAATAALAVTLSRGSLRPALSAGHARSAAASPNAPSLAGPDARRGGIGPCVTSGLRISVRDGPSDRYVVEFTNVSRSACSLRGYPSVSAYTVSARDGGARQLGTAADRDMSVAVRLVVLDRGESAAAPVAATASALPAHSCQPVTAAGLRVVPPGERAARLVRQSLTACSAGGRGGPVFLRVRAVQPG